MIGKLIRKILTNSNRIHMRHDPTPTTAELVRLIDRFLDGPLKYEMEWDDFISWKSSNPQVEAVRQRIGEFEPQLFSRTKEGKEVYGNALIAERNQLARLLNLKVRKSIGDRQIN
jgi:hypothetical protein